MLFRTNFKGENSSYVILLEYTFSTGLHPDTYEPISFKLGTILDTTKFCSMIPVRMTLIFIQGHSVTEKLGRVLSFCCKVALSNPSVCDG